MRRIVNPTTRSLAATDEPTRISTDPISGLPVITLGHHITTADVVDALADE